MKESENNRVELLNVLQGMSKELISASDEFNTLKDKYPTIKTVDVIALIDRLNQEIEKSIKYVGE